MTTYTIGDLAEEFGTTLRALRFYEEKGMLSPARAGTRRIYSEREREKVREILRLAAMGFSLAEIRAGNITREKLQEQLQLMRARRMEVATAISALEEAVAA